MTFHFKVAVAVLGTICLISLAVPYLVRMDYERRMLEQTKAEDIVRKYYVDENGREPYPGYIEMTWWKYVEDPIKFESEHKARAEARRAEKQQEVARASREEEERAERAAWISVTVMLKEQFDQDGTFGLYEAITSKGEHCVVACPESSAKIGRFFDFRAVKSSQNLKFTQTVRNSRTGASWEKQLFLPVYRWKADL